MTRLAYCFDRDLVARLAKTLACVIVAVTSSCSRQDERLQQHRETLESLQASATAIGSAWLSGSTSGTYTLTALDQIYLLSEQARTALASAPVMLADPRGAELSQSVEQLSRHLAVMQQDVRAANASSVRQHLSEIAGLRAERR